METRCRERYEVKQNWVKRCCWERKNQLGQKWLKYSNRKEKYCMKRLIKHWPYLETCYSARSEMKVNWVKRCREMCCWGRDETKLNEKRNNIGLGGSQDRLHVESCNRTRDEIKANSMKKWCKEFVALCVK